MAKLPIFLERANYRKRRLMDAVRFLPVLGLVLWLIPLLWPKPEDAADPIPMSGALWYIFLVWGGLILATLALSIRSRQTKADG